MPCPFGETYQLARTVLAAQVREGGNREPEWGHATVVYDERNPTFGPEGAAGRQYAKVCETAEPEGAVRRLAWQRIAERLDGNVKYLAEGLKEKYAIER